MAEHKLKKQLARLSAMLDLPTELIAGVPKLELTGQSELVLDHHDGIEHYAEEEIVIRVNLGMIRVLGHGLYIRRMNSKQIAVYGTIRAVMIEEEDP